MIFLIGIGPGSIQYVTPYAVKKINDASKVIAFGRIYKTAKKIKTPIISVDRVNEILEHLQAEQNIAILASGDPCFYGILEYLNKNGIYIDEVVPGLSSFQYMMCKLKKSWHNAQLVSMHGRDDNLEKIMQNPLSIVLTDHKNTPDKVSKMLYEKGVKGNIYAGFNLSYEDEYVVHKRIGDDIENKSSLAVVVIENEMD